MKVRTLLYIFAILLLNAACEDKNSFGDDLYKPSLPSTAILDFEGDYWTALIPKGQAYGVATLIYGNEAVNYAWRDSKTGLAGGLTLAWGGWYGFAEGGTVVSNYIDANVAEHASADYQLSVPKSNGSKNFAVVYCGASIHFDEGVSRTIQSMWVSPTTYQLGKTQTSEALQGADSNLTLIITADNGATVEVDLARDGNFLTTWKKISLSSLGKVNSLTFSMDGSDKLSYGVKQPPYFAFDNVVVEVF